MSDGIKVKILGDDSDLQSKLKGAGVAVAKWAAASVVAAAAAGVAMTKSGLDSADALAKEAQQLDTTSKDLATLRRASEMAGVSQEKMASASRALTTRLAQAATGTGTAVDALKRLGIQTDELEGMTLSDRIKTLNQALDENVNANERAAIAAALYGEDAGLAVSKISASTIETATEQVRAFGAALSDVDAAKIENANDTMSQMGLLTQSVTQGLAAQFAPVLDAVAGRIFDAAKETGGFQSAIDTAFDIAVTGAGYVANAFRAIQIAIKGVEVYLKGMSLVSLTVAREMVEGFESAGNLITESFNKIIRAANHIPGVDISEIIVGESEALKTVRGWADTAGKSFSEARQELVDLVNEPWPSGQIKKFVDEANEAGQAAAEAAVKARESAGGVDVPEMGETPQQAGMREELEKRLEAVRQSLLTEQEARDEALELEKETLLAGYEAKLLSEEEYQQQKNAVQERYNAETLRKQKDQADKETAIQTAAAKAKQAVISGSLNNLASLMDTKSRKLFEIGKAAALAQATVDGFQAIQSSYAQGAKVGGPIVGAAFAATAAVATGVQISKIASTSFGGGGGGASAPSGGSAGAVSGSDTAMQNANTVESANSRTLLLQGDFDKNSLYSGEAVRTLMDAIADAQSDGYKVVL